MADPNVITRSNAEALIPQQISNEIIQALPTQSIALRLMRAMPPMTSKQTKIPVMTGLATAGFVTGDAGQKPTSNLIWDNVFINAEELAVMVPIPEAVLDDSSYDIWAQARPRIVEAFGKAIDQAIFFGTNKPSTWPAGLIPAAIAAKNVIKHDDSATGSALYTELLGESGLLSLVEESGIAPNGFVAGLSMRAKLRGALDSNGQPIFRASYSNDVNGRMTYDIEGMPIVFPDNGSWDGDTALMLAGDFNYAVYAIRQDITFKMFDQGVITNGSGGVALSLMENDCVAMRAVIRLGWALPKPANMIKGTNYFPFAVLTPEGE